MEQNVGTSSTVFVHESPDHIARGGQTRMEDVEREDADFLDARGDEENRGGWIQSSVSGDVFLDALGRCATEPGAEGDQSRTVGHFGGWRWLEEMDIFANGL